MQDLIVDALSSKRIPTARKLITLPRLVGEYAKAIRTDRAHAARAGGNSSAKPKSAAAGATPATGVEVERTYRGNMTISGTLSADNGQNGTWSGTLKETLYLTVDGAGNGSGYETFSGNVTLSVGG